MPRPQTQIPVLDEFGSAIAYLDMGWEDVKVAVEYDGDQHRSDRSQYNWDIRRLERLQHLGWILIRSWLVIGRPILSAGSGRRYAPEREVSFTFDRESETNFTLKGGDARGQEATKEGSS